MNIISIKKSILSLLMAIATIIPNQSFSKESTVQNNNKGLIFVVSGPSGVGKNTVIEALIRTVPGNKLQRSVTATTRDKRDNEVNGQDYYFMSHDEFLEKAAKGDFYEYATVHGSDLYGTLKSDINARLQAGNDVILIIDVQGAMSLKKAADEDKNLSKRMTFIFIGPKNIDQLRERLAIRKTETEDKISKRIESAQNELGYSNNYDYYIESDSRIRDLEAMLSIYKAEKLRIRK